MVLKKFVSTSPKRPTSKIGRPSVDESRMRSERLLKTAASIFAKYGYAGTSIDRIAEESGISKRTIYAWFGDKAKLFQAVVAYLLRELGLSEDDSLPNEPHCTGIEVLQANVAKIITAGMQPSFLGIYRIYLREAEQFSGIFEAFQITTETYSQSMLLHVLRRYPEFGHLRIDAEELAEIILGLVHSLVVLATLNVKNYKEISPEREAKKMVDALLYGALEVKSATAS